MKRIALLFALLIVWTTPALALDISSQIPGVFHENRKKRVPPVIVPNSTPLIAHLLDMELHTAIKDPTSESSHGFIPKEKGAKTLAKGLQLIARAFPQKNIYLSPPTREGANGNAPFEAAIMGSLSNQIDTTPNFITADHYMTGEYTVFDDAIRLSYRLTGGNKTATCWFLPPAYMQYRPTPAPLDLGTAFATHTNAANGFKVDIKSMDGRSNLRYKTGQRITIFITMNRPGYFYLMGHATKETSYKYLIHLNEALGNRKFVSYVGPNEVKRWIKLGQFEAIAPYGMETLEIIAATEDLAISIPKTYLDRKTGLYKLGTRRRDVPISAKVKAAPVDTKHNVKKNIPHARASLTIATMAI